MADNTRVLTAFNILLIGFSSQEKNMIATFFGLASRRAPHWAVTTSSREARVVLFNGTSQQDVDAFRSLVADCQHVVIVGASDFGTGWAVMPRPLKLTVMLSLLNTVVKTAVPSAAKSLVAAPSRTAPIQSNQSYAVPDPATFALNEAPSFSEPLKNVNDAMGRVLIVDDSEIALKYMQNRLRSLGYESELAKSGEEALSMVSHQNYHFVFLDVMMEGMDGYKTCRAIKNNNAYQIPPPVVVMLTSRGGTIDKIRGAMSGCDAYLTKPLNEKKLALVLAKYDESTVVRRLEAGQLYEPLVDKLTPRLG